VLPHLELFSSSADSAEQIIRNLEFRGGGPFFGGANHVTIVSNHPQFIRSRIACSAALLYKNLSHSHPLSTTNTSTLDHLAPTPSAYTPTMATVQEIPEESAFASTISALPPSTLAVIYFHAPWAAPCKQMSTVLSALASTYPTSAPLAFLSLNAEELPEISEQYDVTAVPYIVLQKDGKTLETVSGSDAAKVRAAVEKYAGTGSGGSTQSNLPPAQTVTKQAEREGGQNGNANGAKNLAAYAPSGDEQKTAPEYTSGEPASKEDLFQRLGELVKAAPVMLFMKGTPSAPQCGFSRQTVSLLREKGVRYGFFNILADDEVRQGLKEFADWPTFPQVWVDGELVGGLDIVSKSHVDEMGCANTGRRSKKSLRTMRSS
jgi:Grx4 family monothiol glutaredoxin